MTDNLELILARDNGTPPRRSRSTLLILIGVLVLLLVAVGYVAARTVGLIDAPDYSGPGAGNVVVEVKAGDSAGAIGATLEQAGVVKSAAAFRAAAAANDRSRTIGPGYYRLRERMKASLALALMLDPSSLVRSHVVIPEGLTLDQTLARIARDTDISLADLRRVAASPGALGLPDYAHGRLEGFLFPATYDFPPHTSAEQVLQAMVARFRQAAADVDLVAAARAAGRSPYDVVIVASLVEREAKVSADYPKVARVVYNRLAHGMRLQFDSTVNYALKANKTSVTDQDLKVASPYNTYLHAGLPPGPIASPGERALQAALHPASGGWLYFLTVDKAGHTTFVNTYAEFLKLRANSGQSK